MQKYHRERSADPEYQHFVNEETIEDVDVPEQNENETLQEGSELVRTCDIFGKDLSIFRQRPDALGQAPLIFWLLAGYFRVKPERFQTVGLFRVTSTD